MADELDIYDDLDDFQETEDQKCKELQEWETKLANAQVEVNNLKAEKKVLEKKIKTMEINFQNLLDTAKAELKRKDTLITQLRKEKDDICFRRKLTVGKTERSESNPFKVDKHFKGEEIVDVAKNVEKRDKEIKADKQKPLEIVKEKKTEHRSGKQSSSEAANSKRAQDKERELERERERSRRRSPSRQRSRHRSRSRSRERGRSRHMESNKNTKAKESQRSRRSRSRSVSRSRSSHRNSSNKSSTRHTSRESERERERGRERQRHKEKTMETLFGNTPKQNSPVLELSSEEKHKVVKKLLANAEAFTPKELYTPQNQISASQDKQTDREINDYFVSNANEMEEMPAIGLIPGLDLITENEPLLVTESESEALNDNNLIQSATDNVEQATNTIESIPGLSLITEELSNPLDKPSNDMVVIKVKETIIDCDNEESPTTANESIPELNLITEDQSSTESTAEDSNDTTENQLGLLKTKHVAKQTTKVTEHIPGLDLIAEQNEADLESNTQLEDASNDATENTLTKDHADQTTTEEAAKFIDTEEEAKLIDAEELLEKLAVETETHKAEKEKENKLSTETELADRNVVKETNQASRITTEYSETANEGEDIGLSPQSKLEFNNSDEEEFKSNDEELEANARHAIKNTTNTEATKEVTPELQERPANSVQIIEDIRLPVMMDIEHIALRVDGLSDSEDREEVTEETGKAQMNAKEVQQNALETNKESESIVIVVPKDLQAIPVNENEIDLNAGTILLPKPTLLTTIVMYAQPDSTKIDHETLIIPAESLKKPLDVSLETDIIDRALEQLHQQSYDEAQPDEATVTSTSMKAPKQDLITILTQSPVQQQRTADLANPYPTKLKSKAKKTGARSVSERGTPAAATLATPETPERGEKTPLKKRKLNLDDKIEDHLMVPQTPVNTEKTPPSPQHNITIDETLNESTLNHSHSFGSDSSIVTKRCSLGHSDYQFERINDEIVLRVTRRGRRQRRIEATTSIAAIKET